MVYSLQQKDFDFFEISTLRRELYLRMIFQNCILILDICLFFVATALQIIDRSYTVEMAAAFALVNAFLAAMWCHHGARQAQIKQYLLILEARYSALSGWESWLPRHPNRGFLGSRWLVSTKGVLLGTALATSVNASLRAPMDWLLVGGFMVIAATALLLFSNPKERLEPVV